jgi:ABC-type sugar transport system substrate-binding protein
MSKRSFRFGERLLSGKGLGCSRFFPVVGETRMNMIRGHKGAVIAALALTGLLAACSSSSSDVEETQAPASAEASAAASAEATAAASADANTEASGLEEAKTEAARYQDTAGLVYPEPPGANDPGTGRVAIISCGQTGIGCQQMSAFAVEAAKAAGWEPSEVFDGLFDPSVQAKYVQQAINDGYDAIILASIDAASISAAIDAANEAGVPVACITCYNPGFEDKVLDAAPDGEEGGVALATWVTSTFEGKASVVGVDDKSFPIVGARMKGLQEGLAQYCPECTYEQIDFPTAELSQPGPPTWTGFLAANPEGTVDFVSGPYDFFSLPAAKTSAQAGRTTPLIGGYDAFTEFVTAIETGDPSTAAVTVAAPFEYSAWAAMDLVARAKSGAELWAANTMPSALVTKDNAAEFSQGYLRPPFDTAEFFKELWGK